MPRLNMLRLSSREIFELYIVICPLYIPTISDLSSGSLSLGARSLIPGPVCMKRSEFSLSDNLLLMYHQLVVV